MVQTHMKSFRELLTKFLGPDCESTPEYKNFEEWYLHEVTNKARPAHLVRSEVEDMLQKKSEAVREGW